jgi:hypothetical protein
MGDMDILHIPNLIPRREAFAAQGTKVVPRDQILDLTVENGGGGGMHVKDKAVEDRETSSSKCYLISQTYSSTLLADQIGALIDSHLCADAILFLSSAGIRPFANWPVHTSLLAVRWPTLLESLRARGTNYVESHVDPADVLHRGAEGCVTTEDKLSNMAFLCMDDFHELSQSNSFSITNIIVHCLYTGTLSEGYLWEQIEFISQYESPKKAVSVLNYTITYYKTTIYSHVCMLYKFQSVKYDKENMFLGLILDLLSLSSKCEPLQAVLSQLTFIAVKLFTPENITRIYDKCCQCAHLEKFIDAVVRYCVVHYDIISLIGGPLTGPLPNGEIQSLRAQLYTENVHNQLLQRELVRRCSEKDEINYDEGSRAVVSYEISPFHLDDPMIRRQKGAVEDSEQDSDVSELIQDYYDDDDDEEYWNMLNIFGNTHLPVLFNNALVSIAPGLVRMFSAFLRDIIYCMLIIYALSLGVVYWWHAHRGYV